MLQYTSSSSLMATEAPVATRPHLYSTAYLVDAPEHSSARNNRETVLLVRSSAKNATGRLVVLLL